MRKKIILLVTILAFITILAGMCVVWREVFSSTRIYEQIWNIDFPSNMKEVASAKTDNSFHGDGIRYAVFDVPEVGEFTEDFRREKNSQIEEMFVEYLKAMNKQLSIQPDWENEYVWKYMQQYDDSLYLVFDQKEQRLFILQITM